MYKCAKTLMYMAFFVALPALLTACGGAATEEESTNPPNSTTNLINKKTSSDSTSTESSSAPSSTPVSQSSQAQSSVGIDVTPPTTTQLQLYRLSDNAITLIWDDSADDSGISHYEISRNGEFIANVEYPFYKFLDHGLTPYTNYKYTITAFDLTGNASGSSPIFTIRTLAASGAISSTSSVDSQANSSIFSASSNSSASPNSSTSSNSSVSPNASTSSSATSNSSLNSHSSASVNSSTSTTSNSSRSSSISSRASASSVALSVTAISWSHPNQRENGAYLELDEIGGYELRYRKSTGTRYTYITLNGNRTTEYTLPEEMQRQDWEFEIAVFDTAGLYSQFVKITQ